MKDEFTEKVPFDTGILNYQEYKSGLNGWELTEDIKKLEKHIRDAADGSRGLNMLWKYFGLKTAAQPYVGEAGADEKIDLLSIEIGSLRKQVGDLIRAKEQNFLPPATGRRPYKAPSEILSSLPDGVNLEKLVQGADGLYEIHYRGYFSRAKMRELANTFKHVYGIGLRFIDLDQMLSTCKSEAEGDGG